MSLDDEDRHDDEEPALLHVLAAVLAIIDREIGKATL